MAREQLIGRIRATVRGGGDYLLNAEGVSEEERPLAEQILRQLQSKGPEGARRLVLRMHLDGQIDAVLFYSAMHVIAASPAVGDYRSALRHAAAQEFAALERGTDLDHALASVERHRGVVAFKMGRHSVALEAFGRAWGRERTPENLSNVLAACVALDDVDAARDVLQAVQEGFAPSFVAALEALILADFDLRVLRGDVRQPAAIGPCS